MQNTVRGKAYVAGVAANNALQNDELNVDWSVTVANQYISSVVAQHSLLTKQMAQLSEASLADNEESIDNLLETCEKLEAVFEQIDDINAVLGDISEKVGVVAAQSKAIETPMSVRERGASILKSFGFKNKSVAETASASIWARVPPHILMDGSAPSEFGHRVHGSFKDLS